MLGKCFAIELYPSVSLFESILAFFIKKLNKGFPPSHVPCLLSWLLWSPWVVYSNVKIRTWEPQLSMNMWYLALVFLGLGYLSQNTFQFHPSPFPKFLTSYFKIDEYHSIVYVPHVRDPLFSWRTSPLFPFPSCCEQSSSEHGWAAPMALGTCPRVL